MIEILMAYLEVFKAKVEGLWSMLKVCWGWAWWGLGGKAPEKFCDLTLLETPWFAYFSIVANAKNNAQEDYNGYKKVFGWFW